MATDVKQILGEQGKITEDMISEKFIEFTKEGKGMRHLYKLNLLEERYKVWLKENDNLKHSSRNVLMTRKMMNRRNQVVGLDDKQYHIRWIKCISEGMMTSVRNSAILLGAGYFILIFDLESSQWKLFSTYKMDLMEGIGCLVGARDDNLFAYAEKCQGPRIVIVNYPELETLYILKDRYGGKVMGLGFSDNETLLALKCSFYEHRVVIWSWRSTSVIFSYICNKPYLHPDLFRTSLDYTKCAMLACDRLKQVIQVWNINFCGEDTVLINRRYSEINLDGTDIHDMFFHHGVLYLIDSNGHIYKYEYSKGKVSLLISWIHFYTPVKDLKEMQYSREKLIKLSKQGCYEPDDEECDQFLVSEDKGIKPPEPTHVSVPEYTYTEYSSDEYEEDEEIDECEKINKKPGQKCHMIWYNSGIVASGPDCRIKYYTLDSDVGQWIKKWGLIPADPIKKFVTNQKQDVLMGWSDRYGLVKIYPGGSYSDLIQFFGSNVRSMCLLHPCDSFLVTLSQFPEVCIWKKKSGRLLNCIELECKMDKVLCHHNSPLIVLKSEKEGSLYGIDLTNPRRPISWPSLKLVQEPFSWISFLQNTDILLACCKGGEKFILIKSVIDRGFEVLSSLKLPHKLICLTTILVDDGVTRGVALFQAVPKGVQGVPKGYVAGKLFEMLRFPSMIVEKTWASNHFYRSIASGPGIGHVLAIPADKKWEIHNYAISLKRAKAWQYLGCIKVGHQVGTFDMLLYDQHFITYGFDGIVACYVSSEMFDENSKPFCVLFHHHRFDMGIQEAVIDYKGNYLITRGHDGLIVCSRIKTKYQCKHPFHVQKQAPQYQIDISHLKHVTEYGANFWEDVFKEKQFKTDMIISEGRINRIKEEFKKIQELWEEYYAENNAETPENKIADLEFELNKDRLENLIVSTERDTSSTLTFLSNSLDMYKKWIERWKNNCGEVMTVKHMKLKPLIARYYLENFSQSMKPPQFEVYHELLNAASKLDAALFPPPSPKMLPWHQLDRDEEYPEFKLQKFPEDPKALEDADEVQFDAMGIEQEKPGEEIGLEEHDHEGYAGEDVLEEDFGEKEEEKDEGDVPPPPEVFEQIDAYQKEVQRESLTNEVFTPKEKDKIIFQELERLRRFNEQRLRAKTTVLQELQEETDEQFENWKKMYIDKYHLHKDKKVKDLEEEAEEEEEEQSEELFQVRKTGVKEDENLGEEEGAIVRTEGEEEYDEEIEGVEDEQIEEKQPEKIESKHIDHEKQEDEETDFKDEICEEKPPEIGSSDVSTSFSWSELEIGDEAVEYEPEGAMTKLSQMEEKHAKQKKELEVPEWGDLEGDEIPSAEKPPEDPLDEPFAMNGAQSLRFAEIDYSRCNEFTLNGLFTSDIHVSTLQRALEELEISFNKMFDQAVKRKEEDLGVIKAKNSTLLKHIDDLVNVCKGKAIEPPPSYDWSKHEMPDWIWEEPNDEELPVKPYAEQVVRDHYDTRQIEDEYQGDQDPGEEDPFKKQCLQEMMGGVLEVTWQEELQEELEMPKFLTEKEPDEYNEQNIAEVEKYFRVKLERENKMRYHKEVAENEIRKLFAEVKRVVRNFDMDLLNITKRKMIIDACMQCELLKMSRLKQKRLIADRTLENIRQMKSMVKDFHSEGMKLSAMSRLFLRKTALLYNEVDKYNAKQKTIETEFLSKIEPLKLSKKIFENLKLLIKKKPAIDTEHKVYPTELLCIARSLVKCEFPPYFSEATRSFFNSLKKLDSPEHCPPNVDTCVWDILVEYRQMKIVSDLMSKAFQMYAGESEKTASLYYRYFVAHLQRFDRLKCSIRDQRIRLEHHCNRMDFQLVLPDGLVETHQTGNLEDFKDCVYVSKKYIDNLNKEIVELQKKKEVRWKDFDRYMLVVNNAELLHKELRLRIKIKENLLRDVKTAKITKYTKDFLSEYHRKRRPNYEVKLYDHVRQEKLKAMVRNYFLIYYRSIKDIKDADNEKKKWAKDTVDVRIKNEQLAAETQELSDLIEKLDTHAMDKPLQERNEAIMLHGKLKRQMEANEKELEDLENELTRLYKRTFISFNT